MQNPLTRVRHILRSELQTFRAFQIVIALVCVFIPLLLRLSDKDTFYPNKPLAAKMAEVGKDCGYDPDTTSRICKDKWGFRISLSDYVYSSNSYIFGMLYCMAAMLFIFNGAVYFKSQKNLHTSRTGKWYNVILGLSLIGVILCPEHQSSFWHYAFSVLFFVGNIVVIAFLHKRRNRAISIALALLTVAALALALIPPKIISVLIAEWISLAAIATHLIMEAWSPESRPHGTDRKSDSRDMTVH